MASRGDSAGSAHPQSRRSIAHVSRSRLISGLDKENATTDIGAIQPLEGHTKPAIKDKKSRSKSLGPGGLDALQTSNGNRRKSTMALPLKSILKPTIPVSPVRNIPSFEETRKRTPAHGARRENGSGATKDYEKEDLLIDFDTPAQPSASDAEDRANPFDTFNATSAIAAAREREEKERRERERKMILEQREARRKSMANRRVSFAPEATLHTWNVVEIPDDSTTSSASNSTRRASSLAGNQTPGPVPAQREPLSSPETEAESDIAFSPVQYPDLQELRNRPTSAFNGNGSPQDLSSSPFSGGSADDMEDTELQDEVREDDEDDDNSSVSEFGGDGTPMSMDDMSVHSAASAQSDNSSSGTSSSARLNEALRQAAKEAGTRSIDFDEDGEMSMEIADQEITGAFQPWIKKGRSLEWEGVSASHDQENIYPSSRSVQNSAVPNDISDNDEDLSMGVTNALGRIIQPGHRQSTARRRSNGEETDYEEQTMEFTNVIGGIKQSVSPTKSAGGESNASDEEMTMEFTSVIGGVLNKPFQAQSAREPSPSDWNNENNNGGSADDDVDMEMTEAVGGILPRTLGQSEEQDDDQTAGMDFTTAMGRILPSGVEADDEAQTTGDVDSESDHEQLGSSPFQENVRASPSKSPISFHVAAVASESGSPSLASVRSRSTRQSLSRRVSNTPSLQSPQASSAKGTVTVLDNRTPQITQSLTPSQTPRQTPPSNMSVRSASPRKLFQPELRESAGQRKSLGRKNIFGQTGATGESVPLFVLRPHEKRRSSGLGIDKEGLGSPRVAAMLDKRRSIGEDAPRFVPQEPAKSGVRFEDPLKLQEEVDLEREEEENREDGHIPALDATANLRDMISSLTPKKNKLRGRKSLHVGAARGLLGKRPIELDQDDDEQDADNTPKRLKGRNASPVKSIKLPAPPTKDETVGHLTRSPTRRLANMPLAEVTTTPSQEPKTSSFLPSPAKYVSEPFNSTTESTSAGKEISTPQNNEPEFETIQLQDFLNMTNIHFMELTTTKRRHTTAPGSASRRAARLSADSKPASFEDCVAAGFGTVPMLELYQHSCRELKSYISEGRQVIRSIETETYAENPPLFREYATAPPDIRILMDNQFRNVKTHARLLSKGTWYEWRMKLLDGLKEGLDRHVDEMKADEDLLTKYETLLNGVVPSLVEKHASLQEEATSLQQLADEMENCDQDELRNAREKLSSVEDEIELRKKQLQELQAQVQDKTDAIETGAELKAEFLAQIQEAERVKEECHGWSAKEISELKESVQKIERQTGWSIVSATSSGGSPAGPLLTMSYRNQLQLVFHPATFSIEGRAQPPSDIGEKTDFPLGLAFNPRRKSRSSTQAPQLTSVALLVLKSLQKHLKTIQPRAATIAPKHLLRFISNAWDFVLNLEEEAHMLEFCGVTKLQLSEADDKLSLRARCTLLGASVTGKQQPPAEKSTKKPSSAGKRRIDVDFAVTTRVVQGKDAGDVGVMDFETDVVASKIYGFGSDNDLGMSETEMRKILCNGLGEKASRAQLGNGVWRKAVRTLTGTVF